MSKDSKSTDSQREFWQMVIETWANSNLSVRQFCKQEGLSEPSFYHWRKKLSVDENSKEEKEQFESEPFIQISMPKQAQSNLELMLTSGNCLRIGSGTDLKRLRDVISILKQAGLC